MNPDEKVELEKDVESTNTEAEMKNETESESFTIDDSFIEDVYKSDHIDLYKLEGLDVKDQSRVFSTVLTDIYKEYSEVDYSTIRKLALKCLKFSCDPDDNRLRLPYKLIVTKEDNKMYFSFEDKKTNIFLFIVILGLFMLASLGSTYVTLRYLSIAHLNIDIDGDQVADLNIDTNKDDKEEVNISKDGKRPHLNIDYKGNRKPIFNIDEDKDGKPDKNLINVDKDKDGKCDINCDINDDGWPDIKIDVDGDGKPDLSLDVNKDDKIDMNFDIDGDGKCDLHCDEDEDGKCDKHCVINPDIIEDNTGSSGSIGNSGVDISTAEFIIDYIDSKEVVIKDLFPEDQKEDVLKYAVKKFKIHNKSPLYVRYKIEMDVTQNTFTSNNFVYKIDSTEKGYTSDFVVVPKTSGVIANQVLIAPGKVQEYTVTFKLKGINANQNFDQGRKFAGYFQVSIIENPTE